MFRTLFAVAALAFSSVSSATIVDMGNYQYDDQTGLEWLDLSLTDGLSIGTALAAYSGWTLATQDQFSTMFEWYNGVAGADTSVLGFTGSGYQNSLSGGYESLRGSDGASYLSNQFFSDFGITLSTSSGYSEYATAYGWYREGSAVRLGGVHAIDYYNSNSDAITAYYDHYYDYSYLNGHSSVGNFLVRAATTVPEPSVIALLGTGILALGVVRRRRKI